jgi:hypothetical protein
LAAADATPKPPQATDGFTEPTLRTLPGKLERIEGSTFTGGGQHDGGAVQRHSQCATAGRYGWRSRAKAAPPGPNRRVGHVELLRNWSQAYVGDDLEGEATPNDGDLVEPSREHEIREQRMRASTHCTATASNPDAFDQ